MAFGKVNQSSISEIKRYIGTGDVFVRGVNPNKKELEKFFDREFEQEPEYIGKTTINEKEYDQIRLDFLLETDPLLNNGISFKYRMGIFLTKCFRYNRDHTKVQVIDKYGRTAWVTLEQAKNHEIPVYANGPANIDKDYHPAYIGEESLIEFIKCYLCINNVDKWANGKIVGKIDNPKDAECALDKINSYFTGDVSELKDAISLAPNNTLKVSFGIRSNDNGSIYQTAYTNKFLKSTSINLSPLAKSISDTQSNGGLSTSTFEPYNALHEYQVEPTKLENNEEVSSAFSSSDGLPW